MCVRKCVDEVKRIVWKRSERRGEMMLHSILKRETSKLTFVLPFCYRFPVKKNNLIANFSTNVEKRKEEQKGNKLEDNPFYAKYADKIAKAKSTESETPKHEVPEDNEILQFREKIRAVNKVEKNKCSGKPGFPMESKNLKDIVNIDLLMKHTSEEISEIWSKYHRQKANCVYAVIAAEKYEQLYKTGKEFPLFIYPIPRETSDSQQNETKSCYEFVFGQFSNHQIYFTPLLTYQTHKENAPPAMVVHNYPELQKDKKIVLMSAEYDNKVFSVLEAQCLANQIQLFYCNEDLSKRLLLYKFNREPNNFNFNDVINEFENNLVIK
ncbi:ATP synthase mitochondrial F1 complex assembly factor 1-like protein [Leptotrombidium deliense]|uniref:ATP synthase mitochondrial F1 complex assembly factor 1-like protein n=1 Tax=Leptotrombidium deliense TaxID=299467 RepID=A0A443SNN9_9ACAR|nr:ATP synthase mitochondrial F1 complex assembly factor 1-like protein [Leptotrombidium deliense]